MKQTFSYKSLLGSKPSVVRLCLAGLVLAVGIESAAARPFKIIASSSRRTTTHQLTSGNVTLGITDYGGGASNQFLMPSLADISDNEADRYGRMGQVAVRDSVHGGRYNPTQAGFHETLGTQCEVTASPGKLTVEPHGIALWHGDGQYDFTRWENIGADPYTNDGGNSDKDGLDEENLSVVINGVTYSNQEAEVYSEYDYYGTYEDYKGKLGIQIPAFRHYHETRFIRVPGHCVNQHREGTPLYDPASLSPDMSATQPAGSFPGTGKKLNNPISAWNFRWDNAKWTAGYRYFPNATGWTVQARTGVLREDNLPKQAVIVAETNVATMGRAIGFYRPTGEINDFPVIGIVEATGAISYKDTRTNLRRTVDEPFTDAGSMSVPGFTTRIRGLIARDRLPVGIFESWREELFIFYGTPQEIMDAIAAYDTPKQAQTITFPVLPNKTTGDADFSPGATASSGMPVSYTSSATNVATIVGTNIHIVGAGTTTITASQAGSATYFAATNVSRQLLVTLSSLPTATVFADAGDAGVQMTLSDGSLRLVSATNPTFQVGTSGGVSGPAGLTVSGSGQITWSPVPAQAGQTYGVEVRVRDSGIPPLEDMGTFELAIIALLQANNVAVIGRGLQLSWNTIPGRAYGIQTSTNLVHWSGIANDLIAADVLMSTNLPISINTMMQFYRVSVEAQP